MNMPGTEEYANRHAKSFRTAFDFLTAHFPPADDPEWWKAVSLDASMASAKQGENKLVIGLLIGVMDYLEDEWKKRRQNSETEN